MQQGESFLSFFLPGIGQLTSIFFGGKIVCRCGYTMCFVCRKEIGVEKCQSSCAQLSRREH